MYGKILIPLDGSSEPEGVIARILPELSDDTQVILLKVVPPLNAQRVGAITILSTDREEAQRTEALDYLRGVVQRLGGSPGQWSCEAYISKSVPEGISTVAEREEVDLIAMYTHDRKGLARLLRGSVAQKVKQKSPVEVRVFSPRELVSTSP
jgi:nucleotide-binding universal stress UspA family protein